MPTRTSRVGITGDVYVINGGDVRYKRGTYVINGGDVRTAFEENEKKKKNVLSCRHFRGPKRERCLRGRTRYKRLVANTSRVPVTAGPGIPG